jgi:hypothetical protein
MLFTPKKYGRDWTLVLGITFYAAAIGFGVFAVSFAIFGDTWPDKALGFLGLLVAAIIFGALGKDQWHKAAKMDADGGHEL